MLLSIEQIIVDRVDGRWALIDYGDATMQTSGVESSFDSERYRLVKVFTIGRIPCRNIVEVDEDGDEYYPHVHLYCRFADGGAPYELVFQREVDGYAEFHAEDQFRFADRLQAT